MYRKRLPIYVLLLLLTIYAAFYIRQFLKINAIHKREYVMASKLPPSCTRYVETYNCPLGDPDVGGVWVRYCDIDGDGIDELITDGGDLGRGAACSWRAVWRRMSPGEYSELGVFYSDFHLFFPPWTIFGMPSIWCWFNRSEWVPFKNGRYSAKGYIGD